MPTSKAVYRSILREAAKLTIEPVRRKICFNTREVFDLYRAESNLVSIEKLQSDGAAAIRLIAWLNQLPEVCNLFSVLHVACLGSSFQFVCVVWLCVSRCTEPASFQQGAGYHGVTLYLFIKQATISRRCEVAITHTCFKA